MDISESQSGGPGQEGRRAGGQEERVKEEQVIEEDWHTPPRGHGSDSKPPAPHGVELLWTEQRKGQGTGTQVGGTHRWHPG